MADEIVKEKVKNIILIGFMAAGKSTVGKQLAKALGWDFFDTDRTVEQVTGMKIAELFKKHGEVRFRSEEQLAVKRIHVMTHTVISTGGGTVLNPDNWRILASNGVIIHLYVPFETALSRVKNRNERPLLLKSNDELKALWEARLGKYQQAHISIDTTTKDIPTITEEILSYLKGGYDLA